jgi:hypothetical protein
MTWALSSASAACVCSGVTSMLVESKMDGIASEGTARPRLSAARRRRPQVGQRAARILSGLGADGERPATRAAVFGWLGFLDAAILDWIAHGDMTREELHGMLLGTFAGALMASGAGGALTAAGPV